MYLSAINDLCKIRRNPFIYWDLAVLCRIHIENYIMVYLILNIVNSSKCDNKWNGFLLPIIPELSGNINETDKSGMKNYIIARKSPREILQMESQHPLLKIHKNPIQRTSKNGLVIRSILTRQSNHFIKKKINCSLVNSSNEFQNVNRSVVIDINMAKSKQLRLKLFEFSPRGYVEQSIRSQINTFRKSVASPPLIMPSGPFHLLRKCKSKLIESKELMKRNSVPTFIRNKSLVEENSEQLMSCVKVSSTKCINRDIYFQMPTIKNKVKLYKDIFTPRSSTISQKSNDKKSVLSFFISR